MGQIVLNTDGQSDSSSSDRTFTATVGETFFMINNTGGVVTFNISNSPTHAPTSKYHSTNSNGGITLTAAGYIKFIATATTHVVSGIQARHGTSSHVGETLCLVESS